MHDASDQAPPLKGLVVAQGWSRSYARKIRSKKERGSTMLVRHTRMIAVDLPNGSGLVAWLLRFMSGFQPVGRRWWLRDYSAGRHHQRGLPTRNVVGPIQGLPLSILESILGTEIVRVLLAPVGQGRQWKSLTARKCSTRSDNGHYQVLQLCQCSMSPVESHGLNWMIRPSWTAMGCCRRVSFVMCFRRSARLRGRVLGQKGSR